MNNIFSKRLKEILIDKNLKPNELAKLSGVPKSAISQYLSGKNEARQKTIHALAKALNINPVWLLGYNVEKDLPISTSVEILERKNTNAIKIINIINALNEEGQEELLKHAMLLAESARYKKGAQSRLLQKEA